MSDHGRAPELLEGGIAELGKTPAQETARGHELLETMAQFLGSATWAGFAEVDRIRHLPGPDKLLHSLLPGSLLANREQDGESVAFVYQTYNPDAKSSQDVAYLSNMIEISTSVWDSFLTDGTNIFEARQKRPETEIWESTLRKFKRGPDQLVKQFDQHFKEYYAYRYTEPHVLEALDQFMVTMLPYTLLRISRDTLPQDVDQDAALSVEMAKIVSNQDIEPFAKQKGRKKTPKPELPMLRAQVHDQSIHLLRQYYTAVDRPDFMTRLVMHGLDTSIRDQAVSPQTAGSFDYVVGPGKAQIARNFVQQAGRTLGCNPMDIDQRLSDVLLSGKQAVNGRRSGKTAARASGPFERRESLAAKRPAFLRELQRVHTARSLIAGLAEGEFEVTDLLPIQEEIARRPFTDALRYSPEMVQVRDVEWVALRPGVGTGSPRTNPGVRDLAQRHFKLTEEDEIAHQEAFDAEEEARLSWLESMVEAFKDDDVGPGIVVRSNIPSLGRKHQYMVALIPKHGPKGTIIWDAIGDNSPGRHAVFLWRAERGLDDEGRVAITWQHVFDNERPNAKPLGATKMLHRGDLEDRIADYFATSYEKLEPRRHIGSTAVRLTLLGQNTNIAHEPVLSTL